MGSLFVEGCWDVPAELLAAVQSTAADGFRLIPLPPVPKPPRPLGSSRRPLRRWAATLELWTIANRVIKELNRAGGSSADGGLAVDGCGTKSANDLECRIPAATADPRVKAAWSEVVLAGKFIREARRTSVAEDDRSPQGLWSRLVKHNVAIYAKQPGDKYEPFVADRIKELPRGSGRVSLLSSLPG
jgi:hypothetical protein